MKTFLVLILWLVTPGAVAQSVVMTAVVNNASYAPPGSVNEGIALGSIFAVFGSNLAGEGVWQVSEFPIRATSPGGTSLAVTTVNALPLYTTSSQVGAILPSNCPVSDGAISLTYKGETSIPIPIRVVPNNFGIFTQNQGGSGPAAIHNVNSETDRPLNSIRSPARPGQVVILWGTGLGPITASDGGLPPTGDLPVNVEVWVGGKPANLLYKGRSGCCVGVDQIAFYVPDGIEGCFVPVMLKAGGTVSNFASLAVASPGTNCSVPGWPDDDHAALKSESPLRLGAFFITGLTSQGSTHISGEAVFARMPPALLPEFGLPPPGSCTLQTVRGGMFGSDEPAPLYTFLAGGLDAGSLTFKSPMYPNNDIIFSVRT